MCWWLRRFLTGIAAGAIAPVVASDLIGHGFSAALRARPSAEAWQGKLAAYGRDYMTAGAAEVQRRLAADLVVLQQQLDSPVMWDVASRLMVLYGKTFPGSDGAKAAHWYRMAAEAADRGGDPRTRVWVRGRAAIALGYEGAALPVARMFADQALALDSSPWLGWSSKGLKARAAGPWILLAVRVFLPLWLFEAAREFAAGPGNARWIPVPSAGLVPGAPLNAPGRGLPTVGAYFPFAASNCAMMSAGMRSRSLTSRPFSLAQPRISLVLASLAPALRLRLLYHDYFGATVLSALLVGACAVVALLPPSLGRRRRVSATAGASTQSWSPWRNVGGVSLPSVALPLLLLPAEILLAESIVTQPLYQDRYVEYGEAGAALLAGVGMYLIGRWLAAAVRRPGLVAARGVAACLCVPLLQLGVQRASFKGIWITLWVRRRLAHGSACPRGGHVEDGPAGELAGQQRLRRLRGAVPCSPPADLRV